MKNRLRITTFLDIITCYSKSMIKKLITNNFLIQFITLFTSIVTARYLGPEGRGVLALVLLYPQTVANIFLVGIERGFAISIGKKEITKTIDIVLLFAFALTIISWIVVYLYTHKYVDNEHMLELIKMYSLYIPMFFIFMFTLSSLQGLGRFNEYTKLNLLYYISYVLLLISGILFFKLDVDGFVYANLLSVVSVFIFALYLMSKISTTDTKTLKQRINIVFKNSYIFIIPTIAYILTTKIDQFLISNYLDSTSLGLFIVYLAVSRLSSPVTNAFRVYVFHKSIQEDVDFWITAKQNFFLYGIMTLILFLIAKYIVYILYGEEYLIDIDSLKVLIASSFFYFMGHLASEYLKGRKIIKADIYGNIFYLFSLFMIFLLIKQYFGSSLLVFCFSVLFAEIIRTAIFFKKVYNEK
jgi:O-antigen/teichoic acid export membrane protein